MSLRRRQLCATAIVLPRVVILTPLTLVAAGAVLVVGLVSSPASIVLHTRISGMLVAAAGAAVLDDTAALTLASSPTPLLVRRSFRVTIIGVATALWWAAMLAIAELRGANPPVLSMTRELVVLSAVASVGALAAQRWSGDRGSGGAGGLVAIGWFALSFMPPMRWLPLPPDALDPHAATRLSIVVVLAGAAFLVLSRDPAARIRLSRRGP